MMLHSLQDWFAVNQRALPWRKSQPDPYQIWISEVMSQQSVLDTVKRYFTAWMREFPTLADLALASEERVMKQWAGLGYYSRARLVRKTAEALHGRLGSGRGWPSTVEEWIALPGVGPYTAKAISAIAFGEPVLPMDGNLIRVLARFYGFLDPLNRPADLGQIKLRVAELEAILRADPALHPGQVAQSFMDLGATICRPRAAARCEVCPLRELGCVAYKTQQVESIPATKARAEPVYLDYVAQTLFNERGELWVEPLPAGSPGNLIGQWQVPLIKIDESSDQWAQKSQVRHSITKYRYRVRLGSSGDGKSPEAQTFSAEGRWVNPRDPEVHLTTLTRKIVANFFS